MDLSKELSFQSATLKDIRDIRESTTAAGSASPRGQGMTKIQADLAKLLDGQRNIMDTLIVIEDENKALRKTVSTIRNDLNSLETFVRTAAASAPSHSAHMSQPHVAQVQSHNGGTPSGRDDHDRRGTKHFKLGAAQVIEVMPSGSHAGMVRSLDSLAPTSKESAGRQARRAATLALRAAADRPVPPANGTFSGGLSPDADGGQPSVAERISERRERAATVRFTARQSDLSQVNARDKAQALAAMLEKDKEKEAVIPDDILSGSDESPVLVQGQDGRMKPVLPGVQGRLPSKVASFQGLGTEVGTAALGQLKRVVNQMPMPPLVLGRAAPGGGNNSVRSNGTSTTYGDSSVTSQHFDATSSQGTVGDNLSDNSDEEHTQKGRMATAYIELHTSWDQVVGNPVKRASTTRHAPMVRDIFKHSVFDDKNRDDHDGGPLGHYALLKSMRRKRSWASMLVLEPSSRFYFFWTILEGLLLSYDMIAIPTITFDPPSSTFATSMMYTTLAFWTLNVPVSMLKGYINDHGAVEMDLGKVVRKYFKKSFVQDFILLLIEYGAVISMHSASGEYTQAGRFISRIGRLSRLLKVGRMRQLSRRLLAKVKSPAKLDIISTFSWLVCLLVVCHVGACLYYLIATVDIDLKEGRFSQEIDRDLSFIHRYIVSLQWSLSMLGFGYTDVVPMSVHERTFIVVYGVFALIATSLWVAYLVSMLMRVHQLYEGTQAREQSLRQYLLERNVSWSLRNRIWRIVQVKACNDEEARIHEDNVELIRVLPANMIIELRAESIVPVLTVHPFFGTYGVSEADNHAMYQIVKKQIIDEITLEVDQELFLDQDAGVHMYFVVNGAINYRWRRKVTEVNNKGWLSEPSLWLSWFHVGQATAKTQTELYGLRTEDFRSIMQADLPEAFRYAWAFCQHAKRNRSEVNDLFPDFTSLCAIAQDIFEPPRNFDVQKCKPAFHDNANEWEPQDKSDWQLVWATPWNESNILCSSALISTMTLDMKHDVVLIYQTLYAHTLPNRQPFPFASVADREAYERRICFLKRALIMLAVGRLSLSTKDNGCKCLPWKYPLASAISHGSRVLVRLEGVQWKEMATFLLYGSPQAISWDDKEQANALHPLYQRRAATHAVVLDERTLELREQRLRGTSTLWRGHMGMDLPMGGLGNPAPPFQGTQTFVGPNGVPYQKSWHKSGLSYQKDRQHGHMYIRGDDFGTKSVRRLVPVPRSDAATSTPSGGPGGVSVSSAVPSEDSSDKCWSEVTNKEEIRAHLQPLLEDLDDEFLSEGSEMGDDCESLMRLVSDREVIVESQPVDDEEDRFKLRARGFRIHLTIESSSTNSVLIQKCAYGCGDNTGEESTTMRTPSIKRSLSSKSRSDDPGMLNLESATKLEDRRVITVLAVRDKPWMMQLSKYLHDVFKLSESAVAHLMDCLCEDARLAGPGPAEVAEGEPGDSVGFNHVDATVGLPVVIPLVYDAIYLRCRVSDKDLEKLMLFAKQEFQTVEHDVDLRGFAGECLSVGSLVREWKWFPKAEAEQKKMVGFMSPEGSQELDLTRELRHVSSIMFGIENSAPLKSDHFGAAHGVDGKSKEISVCGKRKWRDYRKGGQEVPADLGGMLAYVDTERFAEIQRVCHELKISPGVEANAATPETNKEKDFFKQLLQASDESIAQVLEDRFKICLPTDPVHEYSPLSTSLEVLLKDIRGLQQKKCAPPRLSKVAQVKVDESSPTTPAVLLVAEERIRSL
eukprot:TRINITY_DN7025_c0_g1_i2.p1 TRINITY_DN7025_c0_g1~~TRINITY_DN7025_c0_g1_i2.p1  ORF type:complete len:1732 (-),score=370.65 TRINITY_DN7025_c0_g1_i2:177-5372(-)